MPTYLPNLALNITSFGKPLMIWNRSLQLQMPRSVDLLGLNSLLVRAGPGDFDKIW